MSMDCDGKLLYGAVLDKEQEFPWGDEEIEDWWLSVSSDPCPVETVRENTYTKEGSILFLCIPNKHQYNSYWGDPVKITPDMVAEENGARQILLDFCERFGIVVLYEPAWYLATLCGLTK